MPKRKQQDEKNEKQMMRDRLLFMSGEVMNAICDLGVAIRPRKQVMSEAEMEELERAAKYLKKTLEAALEALRGRKRDPRWKLENR